MTGYTFHEGIPEGLTFDFDSGIFHNPKHLQLQSATGWHSFVMVDSLQRIIVALLHVHIEKEIAVSPLRSPYGSVLVSNAVTPDLITQFIVFLETKLKTNGVKKLTLKSAPEDYALSVSKLVRKILIDTGYQNSVETSAIISISENDFESMLHYSEKKRLRKCKEAGFVFKQLSLQDLPRVFKFLKTVREQKGYSLSMSLEELVKVTSIFSDVFLLTAVMDNEQFVAANISIQVNAHVLYNFYHDHDASYDSFSPVVLLNEGLYQICQQRNLVLLDLGTSQADGKLNESLFNFKLKLGAKPSNKFTFVKIFS